ncbi:uncharacterized protein N7459_008236 [Penicillium hispanicum]|uniref:uncharacterized protein n=1 Tax=Penicillium hispanicum TaxID=1080232 RepID=UPI002540A9F4|nr:uncharacterized protein N7459_008236 [Penicillium hispanicum]KAJ5573809.1 hypothetical protein N7459_008236 [Penicillium hispanicum]
MTLSSSGSRLWRPAGAAVGPAAIRFNSTSSDPTPAPTPGTATSSESAPVDDLSNFDIISIPEQIGYLKELGLDYGWGPTAIMQYLVEHIHIWGDLPWWASVISAGLLVRLALLKPMMNASDTSAKLNNVKHIVQPLRQEMIAFAKEQKQLEVQMKRAELQKINQEHGIKIINTFIPMIQIPLGFGIYRAVRGMCSLPVPSLSNESAFWLNDLTVGDPLFILPAATAVMMYLTFKKGGEAGLNEMMNGDIGKVILYGLPMISFCFIAFQPSFLQLYFVSTGLFALGQSFAINSPRFRTWMGMTIPKRHLEQPEPSDGAIRLTRQLEEEMNRALYPPLRSTPAEIRPPPAEVQTPSAGVQSAPAEIQPSPAEVSNISAIDRYINRFKDFRKNLSTEISDKIKQFQGTGPRQNADGSQTPPPRHTDAKLKAAESYETQERERAKHDREQRNAERQQAYKQALRVEREKAQRSWQRQRETARNMQGRR